MRQHPVHDAQRIDLSEAEEQTLAERVDGSSTLERLILAARIVAAAVIVGLLYTALAVVVDQATATWPPAARAATTGALIATAAAFGLTTGWAVRKWRRY